MKLRTVATSVTLLGQVFISGCAMQPKTLYYWGEYQNQVHEYLQSADGGDIQKQVSTLEAGIEKARSGGQSLPPGYHAQLGMLYYAQGKPDQAVEQLQLEKSTYPESAIYMDRLLARFKKS